MATPDVRDRFETLERRLEVDEYNFARFHPGVLARDARRTLGRDGIPPGEPAPDFELVRAGGGTLRLSRLRGKPVLLHFGSFT